MTDAQWEKIRNSYITLEDGFEYFLPDQNYGCYSAHLLKKIAEDLDKRNEKWAKQIDNEMLKVPPYPIYEDEIGF